MSQPKARPQTTGVPRKAVFTLVGLMLAQLLAMLDMNVTATALPTIVNEFNELEYFSWVTTTYILAATVTTPLYGKLSDLFGRKKIFITAVVLFLAGSALCGTAQSMFELAVFRGVQGLGAGGFIVLAMTIYTDLIPPEHRVRYQGIYMGALTGFTAFGPLIGGVVTDTLGWRWVFLINLPIGLVSLVIVLVNLSERVSVGKPRIDYVGALLLGGAATCVVLLSNWVGGSYSWGSPPIIALVVAAVLLVACWLLVERRSAAPMVPLHLFRSTVLNIANTQAFISGAALFGAVSFLPLMLQITAGANATDSGLLLLPLTIGIFLVSVLSSPLRAKVGHEKWFGVGGVAAVALGLGLMTTVTPSTDHVLAAVYTILIGIGLALVMNVYAVAVMNNAPPQDMGTAVSVQTLARQLGGSLGLAVFAGIFQSRLSDELTARLPAGTAADVIADAASKPETIRSLPDAVRSAAVQGYSNAISTTFLAATALAVVGVVLALLVKLPPTGQEPDTKFADEG